ncbi:MAG TPA: Nramp family divalent metal transporter [Candidatus Baltobacteraceae bacterium]|jgi:NRAMP (natural resistance-associated macrophage protein)-like metal ion transporter
MSGDREPTLWQRLREVGPGVITGAADDDPSGISTYSVAGASTGLSMLWLSLITTPMMAVIQGMCARIGMVTGTGLAATMSKTLPRWLTVVLTLAVVVANTFNVGADFAGMSDAAHLVFKLPATILVLIFGAVLLGSMMYLSYRVLVNIFKVLTISLLAYVVTAVIVHPNWGNVLRNLVIPHVQFDKSWLTTAMGVLGTTITPYLFFWQSSLMVEQEKDAGNLKLADRRGATEEDIKAAHFDVNAGMILSNAVMFFIIVTTALTLNAHGLTHVATAQQAAVALEPLAGKFAGVLFMLGMVGTGLLAIPSLAGSSAYIVSDVFAFRGPTGFNVQANKAPRFYAVVGLGVLLGVAMTLFHIDAIKTLYYSAVLNGLVAVPIVFVLIRIANNSEIMGKWVNSLAANVWAWLCFVLMAGVAVAIFV